MDLLDTTADRSRGALLVPGVELTFKARLPYGGSMFGGWSAGQTIRVTCANLSDPNTLHNCDHSQLGMPFRHS